MANQGNPFNNSSVEGESQEQGNAFADKSKTGNTENQGNPFSEAPQTGTSETQGSQQGSSSTQGNAFTEGSATGRSEQQGLPFDEGGTASVDIYLEEATLGGTNLVLKRANAEELTVALGSLVTTNTDSYASGLVISAGVITLTVSGTSPATYTATLPTVEDSVKSGALSGTNLNLYSTSSPTGTPLAVVDLSGLEDNFTDTNDYVTSITGVGTGTITFSYNTSKTALSMDMTNYLNSNISLAIDALSDVDTTGVSDNQVLTFDSSTSSWGVSTPPAAKHVSSGTVVGTDSDNNLDTIRLTLSDSTMVDISVEALVTNILSQVPTDKNDYINSWAYNSSTKKVSMTYSGGKMALADLDLSSLVDAVSSLDGLSDVTILNTGEGQTLVYTGDKFINKELSINHLEEVDTSATHQVGDILIRGETSYAARPLVVADATDVDTTQAVSGDLFRFNGSVWEDKSLKTIFSLLTPTDQNAIASILNAAQVTAKAESVVAWLKNSSSKVFTRSGVLVTSIDITATDDSLWTQTLNYSGVLVTSIIYTYNSGNDGAWADTVITKTLNYTGGVVSSTTYSTGE